MKRIAGFLLVLLLWGKAWAQLYPPVTYKTQSYLRTVNLDSLRVLEQNYIGFAANPMLSALLPLNRIDPRTDLVSLKYRRFKGFKSISYT